MSLIDSYKDRRYRYELPSFINISEVANN